MLARRDAAFAAYAQDAEIGVGGDLPDVPGGIGHADIVQAGASSDAVCFERQDKAPGTPKVTLATRTGLSPRAWLKASAQRCTCVVTSLIFTALLANDWTGAAPRFSSEQLEACRQTLSGLSKYATSFEQTKAQMIDHGASPYVGNQLDYSDVARMHIAMADWSAGRLDLHRRLHSQASPAWRVWASHDMHLFQLLRAALTATERALHKVAGLMPSSPTYDPVLRPPGCTLWKRLLLHVSCGVARRLRDYQNLREHGIATRFCAVRPQWRGGRRYKRTCASCCRSPSIGAQ